MSACIGAAMTGARAFTATTSQVLAYMHEMLHWAAGGRLPVVMANVNRSLAPVLPFASFPSAPPSPGKSRIPPI